MPLTQLDSTAALIGIDLQKGIVGLPTAQPTDDVVKQAAELARAFRRRGWPVVWVNVTGMAPGRTQAGVPKFARPADWAELAAELDAKPEDYRVTKQRWGAFIGTSLDEYLRQRGVTQLFLTGISTSIGVESTARCAYELGYNVVLVTDAMTDRDSDSHRHSIQKIFPRLGETETTETVLRMLNGPAGD